jgi:SAM-dependent methyltransferase
MKHKTHYDAIPFHLLQGTVLDVGCGDFENQRNSTNRKYILDALIDLRYVGIDIAHGINIDFFDYEPKAPFDTVLAIHVLEHIPISKWPEAFDKLKSLVAPYGYLVIGTPYRQSPNAYKRFKGPENQRHVVFGIDEEMLGEYVKPALFHRYRGPYSQSLMCIWGKGEE